MSLRFHNLRSPTACSLSESQTRLLYKKNSIQYKTYILSLVEDDDGVTSAPSLQHKTNNFHYKRLGVLIPVWKEPGLNSGHHQLCFHTTLPRVSLFLVCWKQCIILHTRMYFMTKMLYLPANEMTSHPQSSILR